MHRAASTVAKLGVILGVVVGCDRSKEYPDCTNPADPNTSRRIDACPASYYVTTGVPYLDVSGVAWSGERGAQGVVLSFAPLAPDLGPIQSIVTGTNGFFGPVHGVSFRFDVTARHDADVLALRSLATRYIQPLFDGPHDAADAYVKPLDVRLNPPLAPGRSVALFATGTSAFNVIGDLEHGFSLVDTQFTAQATIHVVEYETGKDLRTASAAGKADVLATASGSALVDVTLAPLTQLATTQLDVTAPPGFHATTAEALVVYSRSSLGHFATLDVGVATKLPVLPNGASFAYRVKAVGPDGAVTESGQQFLDLGKPNNTAMLVEPPVVAFPADGAKIDASTKLVATGSGLLEHVLVPQSGSGGSIRIVTHDAQTALPDFGSVAATTPKGAYAWTVRRYPNVAFVDSFAGVDAGRFELVASAKPRTVVFP